MKIYRLYILILLIINIVNSSANSEYNISFAHLNVNQGLSQNSVIRIFQDKDDFMWFGTKDGLNKFNGISFEVFKHSTQDSTSISSSDITSIAQTHDGNLWIGTHYGLNKIEKNSNVFKKYYNNNNENSLSSNIIRFLSVDSKNNLWISTTNGLDLYNNDGTFTRITEGAPITCTIEDYCGNICFSDGKNLYFYNQITKELNKIKYTGLDEIYTIYEDSDNNLWIGTLYHGLKRYNRITKKFDEINIGFIDNIDFNNEQIGDIIEDQKGNLILATRNGILIYNKKNNNIDLISHNGQEDGLTDETIIALYKDVNETIWIGTLNGGVNYYTTHSRFFQIHSTNKQNGKPINGYNSFVEFNNNIWIATNDGLLEYTKNDNTYKIHYNNIRSTPNNEFKYLSVNNNKILASAFDGSLLEINSRGYKTDIIPNMSGTYFTDIEIDKNGIYWMATHTNDYLTTYDPNTGKTCIDFPISGSSKTKRFVNVQDVILEDSTIWIATRNEGLFKYNYITKDLSQYSVHDKSQLPINNISIIFKDSSTNLWIGTYGAGICKLNKKNNTFEIYDNKNGLNNLDICGILQDEDKNIWISTQAGVSMLEKGTKQFINYTKDNGFPLNNINMRAFYKDKNGIIYVGGGNGFVSFNPKERPVNQYIPRITITDFEITGDKKSSSELMNELKKQNSITLNYKQSYFTISYSALNYIYPNMNKYSYKLEGLEERWNNVDSKTSASYTNIPPGEYIFCVKGSNNDGKWNENATKLHIKILPPFWQTWWAYIIYILLFVLVIITIMRFFITKEKLENSLKIKQIERQNEEHNHQMKLRLFTNFSHEMRTPLTLIIGPLSQLISNENLPDTILKQLKLMNKNANRLLQLVNQLMDFRKLETGNIKLRTSNNDFISFINDIFSDFRPLAEIKNIKFSLECNVKEAKLWFNLNQLEQVMFNLLSNAFRHTMSDGEITVKVEICTKKNAINKYGEKFDNIPSNVNELIEVEVKDSGNGINSTELNKIFDPFYQANSNEVNNIYGTGIGLNLVKGIIELHKGTIWAESSIGKGAVFRFFLPIGHEHLSDFEIVEFTEINNSHKLIHERNIKLISELEDENNISNDNKNKLNKRYTVIIVEDNIDVRFYIKSQLKDFYNIKEAETGIEGKELILSVIPDLIICDIMIPGIDGLNLCKEIKRNEKTSHIPIILLTARTSLEQIKEGFEAGADDYITKPFNPDLLITKIESLVSIREKLRNSFSKKITVDEEYTVENENSDEAFLKKVHTFIIEKIDDPELRIEDLAKEIGMSRTQLYRRIKTVTGMAPQKYLLDIRLQMAAQYLKEGLNVSETCIKVGFSDPSYFSKRFKAYYNISPSEFSNK